MPDTAGEKFIYNALLFIVATLMCAAFSFVTSAMWFAFDDALAEIVGAPWLANLGFWQVFAFLWFWGALTSRVKIEGKK